MINTGTRKVKRPRNFHFGLSSSKAFSAFFFVFRPIATSVVSNTNPKVNTSTRYTRRNRPPPSFAHKYGNLQIFPTPTALPAAAKTKPIEPEKLLPFSFISNSPLNKVNKRL